MRLLVVSASPPESSRSRPSQRRMAAQPPGPGLPEQAPSVWTSTTTSSSGSGESIGRDSLDAAVEAELAQVLARVLGLDQGALDLMQPVVEPCHQEAERRPPGEDRQGVQLGPREWPARPVALEQRLGLGDVERQVALE